nr:(S)-8-oxocitronellyl enol synthase ISY1-like [Lolium perenne]XP_051203553.1 (S)-8-oxocitronellyl enol synthase ISY1-like [Lolium perenne]XP_051203554.1 (S)-8-oxocitronellyl enol synthase ISY1-like [Lolium perenne]
MSWWWARAIGAVKKRQDENAAAAEPTLQSVALVVGSTGIVGTSLLDILPLQDTPGGPWKVYALSRRPLPPWSPPSSPAVTNLHLDLADSAAVADALEPLKDITHVFYAAWSSHPTEDENRRANSAMLRNVLSVVVPNCPALVHVCLQTGCCPARLLACPSHTAGHRRRTTRRWQRWSSSLFPFATDQR